MILYFVLGVKIGKDQSNILKAISVDTNSIPRKGDVVIFDHKEVIDLFSVDNMLFDYSMYSHTGEYVGEPHVYLFMSIADKQ
jgi:hypothetical protein